MALSYLLKGTFWLTAAGLISRIAGFFYKIFLSRVLGAEELGLFQLCMPLYLFCLAAASGGIQTALSRFTAEAIAKKDGARAARTLSGALFLSLLLSCLLGLLLWCFSGQIAVRFLLEPRCALLLKLLALSLPFSAGHACLTGCFLGKKQAGITAASQLVEQFLRIGSAVLCCLLWSENALDASVLALGTLSGEVAAFFFCFFFLPRGPRRSIPHFFAQTNAIVAEAKRLLAVSAPLSAGRMLFGILQAIEAALLPQQLRHYGFSAADALSLYGILSGMVLPLLLFPTAITGALGMLLLPLISEAQTLRRSSRILSAAKASFLGSLLLGLFFCSFFFLSGDAVGWLLFRSAEAGLWIRQLSFVCPLLYSSTALAGVLHGIGKTAAFSVLGTSGFLLRLLFVFLAVPRFGLYGYLPGLFLGQLFLLLTSLFLLCSSLKQPLFSAAELLLPFLLCLIAVGALLLLRRCFPFLASCSWPALIVSSGLLTVIFAALLLCGYLPKLRKRS